VREPRAHAGGAFLQCIASVPQLNLGIRKRKADQTPLPAYDPVHTEHDALAGVWIEWWRRVSGEGKG
jgi:hypothetical protein